MYFPYFRGRQFELLALRELVENDILSQKIIPIIEPVKLSSTLIKTLEAFNKKGRKVAVIVNPQVGNFFSDLRNEDNLRYKERLEELIKLPTIIKTHIFNEKSELQLKHMIDRGTDEKTLITICKNKDFINIYEEMFASSKPQFSLISDESIFRRKITSNRVLLDDKFSKLPRNIDYADIDEPFSDDHLYYKDDGYKGFSDYSIIGDEYSEAGFAPYAIAIHIVYFDKEYSLRIKHFVSDTNDDTSDPANKFSEAVSKLIRWNKTIKLDTKGMNSFLNLFETETYPGLGTVKKLSIMHHLELIGQYLDKE